MADELVLLRDVMEGDLPALFEHQRDPVANRMAAFPARDREAFMAHWAKILDDDTVITSTILFGNQVAGNIVCFDQSGRRLIGYWLGRPFWGKGSILRMQRGATRFVFGIRCRRSATPSPVSQDA